jgi:hypothetical protein
MSLLVCVALASAAPATAEISVGAFGGPNIATLAAPDVQLGIELRHRTSFAAGGLLSWTPRAGWTLELQPMFVRRGATARDPDEEVDIRIDYFDVPVLVKRDLGHARVRPYVLGGFGVGFRTAAEIVDGNERQDIEDDVEGHDWSVRLGAGVRVPAGRAAVILEADHAWGLVDINRSGQPVFGATKNRAFQLRVGVSIPVGGN